MTGFNKMMRGAERERWEARNLRENTGYTLKPGDRFMDCWWQWNTVAEIDTWGDEPPSVENHGTIRVIRDDGTEESYAHFGWEKKFRVVRF